MVTIRMVIFWQNILSNNVETGYWGNDTLLGPYDAAEMLTPIACLCSFTTATYLAFNAMNCKLFRL